MPELPEVQTVIDTLRPKLLGRRIASIDLARRDIVEPRDVDLPAKLLGQTVHAIDRRGKRIIFTLDHSQRFFIHLGMSGRLTLNSPEEPVSRHTHLIVHIAPQDRVHDERPFTPAPGNPGEGRGGGDLSARYRAPSLTLPRSTGGGERQRTAEASCSPLQLRFRDPRRFGGVWWLGSADCDAGMGPEPLTVRPSQLAARLARTTRAIKNALLDQSVLAGLGNIYVDESLFAAGIHPLAPANDLTADQIARLNRAIKSTLRRAIRHRGSTLRDYRDANGNAGAFQSLHRVYDRAGKPCPTCKAPIERIVLGGRSTHFCPKCQRP